MTLLGVVGINLLAGIGLGVAWAVLRLLRKRTKVDVTVTHSGERTHVILGGALTFVGVPRLSAALAAIPGGRTVDVDLEADMVDHAAFEALLSWRASHERTGGHEDMDMRHEGWPAAESPDPHVKRDTQARADFA